jgi:hypothetical protein
MLAIKALMRIKKSPYSQLRAGTRFRLFLLSQRKTSYKDLHNWEEGTTEKGQN